MRILYVSRYVPNPPHSGGQLRVHHLLSALVEDHDVTFVSLIHRRGEAGGPREPDESLEGWELAGRFHRPPIVVKHRLAGEEPGAEERGARPPLPWWASSPDMDSRSFARLAEAMEPHLAALPLDEFDSVHVAGLHMAPWALSMRPRCDRARFVVDVHDLLSVNKAREMPPDRFRWTSRWRWKALASVLRARLFERWVLPRFDAAWACSEVDRRLISALMGPGRVATIPNGVDVGYYDGLPIDAPGSRLVFVGDYSYAPNEEGACHLVGEVLPLIREQVPGVELDLVGKNPPESVRRLEDRATGVTVTGRVPDTRPYLRDSAVAVVPLLTGSGTRLKILEAMAAGRPVVSTSIGAEGLEVTPGVDIFLADDPRSFAGRCAELLRDPILRRRMGAAGRRLVSERYDWSAIGRLARDFYASPGRGVATSEVNATA